jgi:hypothetical protein
MAAVNLDDLSILSKLAHAVSAILAKPKTQVANPAATGAGHKVLPMSPDKAIQEIAPGAHGTG